MPKHCQFWTDLPEDTAPSGVRRRSIDGEAARLTRIVVRAGTKAPRHSHNHEQFVQVISGSGTLETDQGRVAFGPGSVFYFPADVGHAAEFETETVLVETNLSA